MIFSFGPGDFGENRTRHRNRNDFRKTFVPKIMSIRNSLILDIIRRETACGALKPRIYTKFCFEKSRVSRFEFRVSS